LGPLDFWSDDASYSATPEQRFALFEEGGENTVIISDVEDTVAQGNDMGAVAASRKSTECDDEETTEAMERASDGV
jgi:hypothetical protein